MFNCILTSKTWAMLATEVIKKKRNGTVLNFEEIEFFISSYTREQIPDYQMASLLMAIFLNGMNDQETTDLTQVMLESGERIHFENSRPVDKHSTGGVGDKTSLILAPIVAACGVPVPMMSGRGLGHTGGTLDKLESIPGFNVNLSLPEFKKNVNQFGLCFIGQTKNICPADKKIYALRDVTGTVESLPLICASIMSKKIAEGIKGLVLDVKFGSGAFMKTIEQAQKLAEGLIAIGKAHGIETKALLTNMNQPLGRFVGNALEVGECLSILKQEKFLERDSTDFSDTEDLSLSLSAEMIAIGKGISSDEARNQAEEALHSGKAYDKFAEICKAQGGSIDQLKISPTTHEICSQQDGFLSDLNSEKIGVAGIELNAGRKLVTDPIDPTTGIEILKKTGDSIKSGEPLFRIYANSNQKGLQGATNLLSQCYQVSDQAPQPQPLVARELN